MMKKVLITGISGQDGYFLSQLLIEKKYEVHGLVRRDIGDDLGNLKKLPKEILSKIKVHYGDITDSSFIDKLINDLKPSEIYHLAAQSFVTLSFKNPKSTYDINIGGTLNIANAVKDFSSKSKVYFAGTSELFGSCDSKPRKETDSFYPKSPYAISKLAGFWTIKNYRETYGLFMANGILFNHESEVRGSEFVTMKIVKGIIDVVKGNQDCLKIGNMDSMRDWGYAKDYVEAMWLILQQKEPSDFVVATGKSHSVREFIEEVVKSIYLESIVWKGTGLEEKGYVDNKLVVKVSKEFYRPNDVTFLKGNASKARKELGWKPKINFKQLVEIMVESELNE